MMTMAIVDTAPVPGGNGRPAGHRRRGEAMTLVGLARRGPRDRRASRAARRRSAQRRGDRERLREAGYCITVDRLCLRN